MERCGVEKFEIELYMGKWYELAHYPSWFQHNDDYNTTAEYSLNSDGSVNIKNCTTNKGVERCSYGKAVRMGNTSFRVDFSPREVSNLVNKGYKFEGSPISDSEPNYVIMKLWYNCDGQYMYAVVSDNYRRQLYVLSRTPTPSPQHYSTIMQYVGENYDSSKLVQTPHY